MSGRAARKVLERVVIEGNLELRTPAHLGNGDVVGLTDMPLLRDALDGKTPLLTGASIAGALRSYVREYEWGYGAAEKSADRAEALFGAIRGKVSHQSWLLIDDALGRPAGTELRDGVSIVPQTRTAEEGKKYDTELLAAGTTFPLRLELLLPEGDAKRLETLAIALRGLQSGEIGLGMRKRRGLGECRVSKWCVRRYDLRTPAGLIAWLDESEEGDKKEGDICQLLGVTPTLADAREEFRMSVTCQVPGSLLIRSGSGGADSADMVHLRSKRPGVDKDVAILSGTSLAGALRARALRIANTVLVGGGVKLVDRMFGKRIGESEDEPSGSRVVTHESELQGTQDWVQSRVKIDRFTGGSFPQALFSEQPAFGGDQATVKLEVVLRQPDRAEIGLLLLVLKDLWTGDLPLGGESSVGRGRLQGQKAELLLRQAKAEKSWVLEQEGNALALSGTGTRDDLEKYVTALHAYKEGQ